MHILANSSQILVYNFEFLVVLPYILKQVKLCVFFISFNTAKFKASQIIRFTVNRNMAVLEMIKLSPPPTVLNIAQPSAGYKRARKA